MTCEALPGFANPKVDDSWLLAEIVRAVLARAGAEGWSVEQGEFWHGLTPPEALGRDAGWKLHVSATQLAAPVVLARVAEVLVRDGCAFKFARGLDQLGELLSNRCDRGMGGKFMTAYPGDDEQFRRLAAELDRVTDGLPGPAILSDHRLRPGSLVHYRYGAFGGSLVLSNDGTFQSVLTGPGGRQVVDERRAWFSPPPWVTAPLPEPPPDDLRTASAKSTATPPAVLIGDRFVVRKAVRHSYRGGVYRALDRQTGTEVILKQARPHVMSWWTGADARDALRHEACMLDLLSPLGLAPQKVALVTHQEHLFLAEELVTGTTLRRWTSDRVIDVWRGQGAPLPEAIDLSSQLVDIVAGVHAQDLVLRDLTPNNLMVTPEGRLRLIDLEHAVRTGSRALRVFTPGYAGPEQMAGPQFGPAPAQSADLFSLGATIIWLASGVDPMLLTDEPADRSYHARLARLVTRVGAHMPAVDRLSPLVLGLTHDDPSHRWSLVRAREFLATGAGTATVADVPAADGLPVREVDRLIIDGLSHVLRTTTPDGPRLWNAGQPGSTTDPCAVEHGAAGILGVLTRAAQQLGDDRLRAGVATVAGWIGQRLFDIPRILPGLYFGRSGTAWALYDAARLLGDDALATRAIELAKRVPVRWPNPDISHGAAGAGMSQLYLWKATGDPDLMRRGVEAADTVLQAARERDGQLVWPIPADFDSTLAGLTHYGFAHGVAGTGAFLLYAGLATDRPEYLDAARRAGQTLEAVVEADGAAAWWPSGEDNPESLRKRHWCSGSSGVGTFLIRLWAATGEQRFRDLAEAAAAAIRRDRWYSTTATCHGLAGDGDYLLDLVDFTGEQRYQQWATELASVMHAWNTTRDGFMVLPDESWIDVTVGYHTGLSGALGFLLRLRHGGSRWWMPDEILRSAAPRPPAEPAPLAPAERL